MTQGQLKDRHITGYGWWIKRERRVFSSFQDSLLNHRNQRGADGCKNGHRETEYGWEEETESQGLERVKGNDNSETHSLARHVGNRLVLFVISCQQLLAYNLRVKSKMTVYLLMTGKPFLQGVFLSWVQPDRKDLGICLESIMHVTADLVFQIISGNECFTC